MIQRISGLADTVDVNEWENRFIKDMVRKSHDGKVTTHLSGKEVEKIEQIFDKHFAG